LQPAKNLRFIFIAFTQKYFLLLFSLFCVISVFAGEGESEMEGEGGGGNLCTVLLPLRLPLRALDVAGYACMHAREEDFFWKAGFTRISPRL
jgi:hypothetical protein